MPNQLRNARPIPSSWATVATRTTALTLACMMLFASVPAFARAPNPIDPAAVRANVEKLGVGEHVMVKRTEGPTLRGHITAIEQEAFKLRPDKSQAEVSIPYEQVVKIRRNPGALTWMAVGAILVIVVIVATR